MKKGFFSFLLKKPLMGIRKKLHHFLRSMLERGLSTNFTFFLNDNNPPKFHKKVEVEFASLYLLVFLVIVLFVVEVVVVVFAYLFHSEKYFESVSGLILLPFLSLPLIFFFNRAI